MFPPPHCVAADCLRSFERTWNGRWGFRTSEGRRFRLDDLTHHQSGIGVDTDGDRSILGMTRMRQLYTLHGHLGRGSVVSGHLSDVLAVLRYGECDLNVDRVSLTL